MISILHMQLHPSHLSKLDLHPIYMLMLLIPIHTATFDSCTCGIVKPHAVKSKLIGKCDDKIKTHSFFQL